MLVGKQAYQYIADNFPYCELCGSTYNLHIHHIIYGKMHGTRDSLTYVDNLIRLCNDCHLKVHTSKIKWQPILKGIVDERRKSNY